MTEEKTRVEFNAPKSPVERADSVGEILDSSRTHLLIDALEGELDGLADDAEFRRRLGDAFYDDCVDFDTVGEILGREKARMQLLWDAFDRTPAGPRLDGELPGDKALYDGEVLEWTGSHPPGSTDDSQV